MSRAYHVAAQTMAREGIARVVVTLSPRDMPDGSVDHFPEVLVAERPDGTRAHGIHARVGRLVWDAAEARWGAGRVGWPVLLTVPGSGIWACEAHECNCDPWAPTACVACGGTGWVYRRKDNQTTTIGGDAA